MNPGGWSPLGTAQAFSEPRVWWQLSEEWGEAVWTAGDLFWRTYQDAVVSASMRFLVGLP